MAKANTKETKKEQPEETDAYEQDVSKRASQTPPAVEDAPQIHVSEKAPDALAAYIKAYPENKVFHVSTDGQVFLDKNKQDAINHQKQLGGQLKSYTAV